MFAYSLIFIFTDEYALSVVCLNMITHYKILQNVMTLRYFITSKKTFSSIRELVNTYRGEYYYCIKFDDQYLTIVWMRHKEVLVISAIISNVYSIIYNLFCDIYENKSQIENYDKVFLQITPTVWYAS